MLGRKTRSVHVFAASSRVEKNLFSVKKSVTSVSADENARQVKKCDYTIKSTTRGSQIPFNKTSFQLQNTTS